MSSSTSTLNSEDMSPRSSTLWLSISLGWGTTSLLLDVSGFGSSGGGGASGSTHWNRKKTSYLIPVNGTKFLAYFYLTFKIDYHTYEFNPNVAGFHKH